MSGVSFPSSSTSETGRAVWADAVREVDPALAGRIDAEQHWRKGYLAHVVDVTAAATRTDLGAVAVARAGLASLAQRMRFGRDGTSRSVPEALAGLDAAPLGRRLVTGDGERVRELVVPYRGADLRGTALQERLEQWARDGVVERSFADALSAVVEHPQWLDARDLAFGVLGAGAELGPTLPLLRWGARVVAVDLPDPRVWQRLVSAAGSSAGTLEAPVQPDDRLGVDLLAQLPEAARWLADAATGMPLTVGSYAYADGATHVLVSVASDAVVEHLQQVRPATAYAELATPTDAYAVPYDVVERSRLNWAARGWRGRLQDPVRALTRGGLYAPAYDVVVTREGGTRVGIADGLVPQQGPNYTLAKRVQRWRAVVAQADGHPVSANVAPATSTRSVTRNRLLGAAYAGASAFGVEVFRPETSRVLMAALLVHDLRRPRPAPAHPDDLLAQQAAHGGLWTIGYSARSVLGLAAVRGLPSTLRS